jgi:hypothetical protein
MNRFGQMDFTGNIRFIKSGVRNVKTKSTKSFDFTVNGVTKSGKAVEGKYEAV